VGSRVRGVVVVVVVLAVGAFAGSALSQWWTAPIPVQLGAAADRPSISGERVRVEVLNGGGVDRMAQRATEVLRDHGFDVVFFGNADVSDADTTVVLLRAADRREWASTAVEVLGTGTWVPEANDNRYVDLTIVLGSDWSPEMVPVAAEIQERPWWDIRPWFRRPGAPEDTQLADPA
jgi:hypothetical protein